MKQIKLWMKNITNYLISKLMKLTNSKLFRIIICYNKKEFNNKIWNQKNRKIKIYKMFNKIIKDK